MKHKKVFCFFWATTLLVFLGFLPGRVFSQVLAKVNGTTVTLKDFEKRIEESNLRSISPPEDRKRKEETLDKLILEILVEQKAKNLDLSANQEFLNLKKQHMDEFLLSLLYEKQIVGKTKISRAEIDSFYKEHQDEFWETPELAKTSHILARVKADSSDSNFFEEDQKAKEKLTELKRRIDQGEDFATLAKEYSDDETTKDKGGLLGNLPRGMIIPEFQNVVFSLKPGEVSQPVRTSDGYHLILVSEIKKGKPQGLNEKVRKNIFDYLAKGRQSQNAQKYLENLRNKAELVYNEEVLTQIDSTVTGNPWIMIINQKDTVWFKDYYNLVPGYMQYENVTFLTLEDKKGLLSDNLSIIPILKQDALARGYHRGFDYKKEEKNFVLSQAKMMVQREGELKDYTPTEEEIKEYYLSHPEEISSDSSVHVYHIVFDDSMEAEKVREEILGGADFVEMAKKYFPADNEIKESVYDLGYISRQEMPEQFYQAAMKLGVGEVSPPVKTQWGYHLIKVVDKKIGSPPENNKKLIESKIRGNKMNEFRWEWERKLKADANIRINRRLLDRYQLKK
jgi:peptidyl-prolyl cis-trans isomerase C